MTENSIRRANYLFEGKGSRVQRIDRIATWVISASGILVIASVIAILVEIVIVALPLLFPPESERLYHFAPAWLGDPGSVLAVGTDEYLETGYVLTREGEFIFFDARTQAELDRVRLEPPPGGSAPLLGAQVHHRLMHTLHWSGGAVSEERVSYAPRFDDEGARTIAHEVERLGAMEALAGAQAVQARSPDEGSLIVAHLMADNSVRVTREVTEEDLLGNVTSESSSFEIREHSSGPIHTMFLDRDGTRLFAGTRDGYLLTWRIDEDEPELTERIRAFGDGEYITALSMVYGDTSLAVGTSKGRVSTWFPVPVEPGSGTRVFSGIHDLAPHRGPVAAIIPSQAGKTIVSIGEDRRLLFQYPTNERTYLEIAPTGMLLHAGLSTRGSGLIGMMDDGRLSVWAVDAPHPEFNLTAMFDHIWYEGFEAPAFVWQSSAATDDAEPKLSLTPLVFGTFKGTFYALLFAVPIAVFAAIYTSTLMDPRLRLIVKPTVEIMGAVPTVVIGFLAALWFAPLIENALPAVFVFILVLPLVLVLFLLLWERIGAQKMFKRVRSGFEFLLVIPAIVIAVYLAVLLGDVVQHAMFGGDFRQWMYDVMGTRVDQRNSVVIAFALGFAVIPIIFTISEDALIRVPRHLRAASLALGATRWQTAWRVLLPSASPGIFAASMIGFGRAVGETMIVLMATGNTPIIDTSIFNGMRTLSANIAVEIPEAPLDGTLYRVLFLSGVLLFTVTFLANTAAEVVRHRLRKKYSRL